MRKYKIFPPAALVIYKNGLISLTNNEWLFQSFRDYLHSQIVQGKAPEGLLTKTIHDGLLQILGSQFFDQVFSIVDNFMSSNVEMALSQSMFICDLLGFAGVSDSEELLNLFLAIDELQDIQSRKSIKTFVKEYKKQNLDGYLYESLLAVMREHQRDISSLRHIYSVNFAERAFHDRQFCEYLSFALTQMHGHKGVPVLEAGSIVIKRVKRRKWPSWLFQTLLARERGICAKCGNSFAELQAEPQIDHIVPIVHGGSNDLVNLQLLCEKCNSEKQDKQHLVVSSIPQYFKWHRRMRTE
jgi:hypothetical protein